MAESTSDDLRGEPDLSMRKTRALEPVHGWGIGQRIRPLSRDAVELILGMT